MVEYSTSVQLISANVTHPNTQDGNFSCVVISKQLTSLMRAFIAGTHKKKE